MTLGHFQEWHRCMSGIHRMAGHWTHLQAERDRTGVSIRFNCRIPNPESVSLRILPERRRKAAEGKKRGSVTGILRRTRFCRHSKWRWKPGTMISLKIVRSIKVFCISTEVFSLLSRYGSIPFRRKGCGGTLWREMDGRLCF